MGEVISYTKDGIDVIQAASIVNGEIVGTDLILTRGNDTTIVIPIPEGEVTQAELDNAIAALVDASPATLNTLNELAAALADDPNFATTMTTALADKADVTDLSYKLEITDLSLGNFAGSATEFTWVEVSNVCKRGLMWRFTVAADDVTTFAVSMRDAAAGGGNEWMGATGMADGEYSLSVPVYIEGNGASSVWVGIKNTGASTRAFVLQALRLEVFA